MQTTPSSIIRSLLFIIGLFFFATSLQAADKRVALVIGNSDYDNAGSLANPRNDAEAITKSLKHLGFEVISGFDVDRVAFVAKIREFSKSIRGAKVALLYYAGHGMQVNGSNYLLPTDTALSGEEDLEFEAIHLRMIMAQMEREKRTNLIFLDACRNNPLARNLARNMGTRSVAIGQGLAPIQSGVGTLIAFATQPGNVALDGKTQNSPFTGSLVRHIETPGLDIAVVLRRVRQDVIDETTGEQVPWSNSSLTGSVILKAGPPPDKNTEISFWKTIKDSDISGDFQTYLNQYPTGLFSEIAALKIAKLNENSAHSSTALPLSSLLNTSPEQEKILINLGIQQHLNRLGCNAGETNGIWGADSNNAMRRYANSKRVLYASLTPNSLFLTQLKNQLTRVCPLICAGQTTNIGGRCVPNQ